MCESLAKALATLCLQVTQKSRPNLKICTPEPKYCSKAALCANLINPNYVISHEIGLISLVDRVAAPPTIPYRYTIKYVVKTCM